MTRRLIGLVSLLPLMVLSNCGGATMPAESEEGSGGSSGDGGGTSLGGTSVGSTTAKGGSTSQGGTYAAGGVPASGGWGGFGGTAGYGGSVTGGCIHDGLAYFYGETFPAGDGCNDCFCSVTGISCTDMACPVGCYYNGMYLNAGESIPAGDGCNYCTCQATSATGTAGVACTKMACTGTCKYAGRTYPNGSSFPATDGCNKCTCSGGSVGCTEIGCTCSNTGSEYWRTYVAKTSAQCANIAYECPINSGSFANACGCGCEQSPECPRYFQCVQGSTGTSVGSAGATGTADIMLPSGTGGQAGVAMPVPVCATAVEAAQCPLTSVPLL